jgi:signal transduction histidine kinase
MTSLQVRLALAILVTSLGVAAIILVAVRAYSSEQIAHLIMEGATSETEAQAMVDEYLVRVVLIAGLAGIVLSAAGAWVFVQLVLRPLARLADATRRVAAGDLAARVEEPADTALREVARSFNEMTAGLERGERLRRRMVEDVAHELRTPLTTLRGYTEALADGIAEPTPDMLRTLHEEIERLSRLVDALDQLARQEAPVGSPPPDGVDLAGVVGASVAIVRPALEARGTTIAADLPAHAPAVRGGPDEVRQVVANLLDNAVRYTPDGGRVEVVVAVAGGGVRVTVGNSGPTIPPDELPLVWERFHRVDPSRSRATGGAGIGLAIVRGVVERLGGAVHAASSDGWTRFSFWLPAAPDPPAGAESGRDVEKPLAALDPRP